MVGRDWRRIEAELDELIPAGPHSNNRPAPNQVPQSPGRSADEDTILRHIAEALELDLALSNRSALRLCSGKVVCVANLCRKCKLRRALRAQLAFGVRVKEK